MVGSWSMVCGLVPCEQSLLLCGLLEPPLVCGLAMAMGWHVREYHRKSAGGIAVDLAQTGAKAII